MLLVEDEPAQREVLAYNLAAEGFEVLQATTGAEAELMVAETPPDVILLDWMLPGMSGIELVRRFLIRERIGQLPLPRKLLAVHVVDDLQAEELPIDSHAV